MNTKVLLSGLIGFFIGGLLVSIIATTTANNTDSNSTETMSATEMLKDKKGADFDKAYIEHMIGHHQDAVDMSELAAENAERQEIKDLATNIIAAQTTEITQMEQWLVDWGYTDTETDTSNPHSMH